MNCLAWHATLVRPLGLLHVGLRTDVVYMCAGFAFGNMSLLLCFALPFCFALVDVSTCFASHWVTH